MSNKHIIKKVLALFSICLLAGSQAIAQSELVKTAVKKISRYPAISYTQIDRQKNPFTGDWITLKVKSFVNQGLYDMHEDRGYRYIYNGTAKIELDLNNKTYTLKQEPGEEPYYTPYYWATFLADKYAASPEKIRLLPDTTIGRTTCYHIRMVMKDSASSKQIHDLCLSKTTYLPVYVRQYLQGRFGKGDLTDDHIALMINESRYSNYDLSGKGAESIRNLTIPADFQPEKKIAMLTPGTPSPDWELRDLKGNTVANAQLKGKVVLLDFSFNACAACMLSMPMLQRLHEKYEGSDVSLVTINTSDPKPSVIAYARKNNLHHTILLNGSKVAKSFQVTAYPSFYLIDKNGSIAAAFESYSKELENNITEKISQLNK